MTTAAQDPRKPLRSALRRFGRIPRPLSALSRALPGRFRRGDSANGYDPDPKMLRNRLDLPLLSDVEETGRQQRLTECLGLIVAGDIDALITRLAGWEDARRLTRGRSSFVSDTLFAVQAAVLPPRPGTPTRTDIVDALEAAYAARSGCHLTAALLAMAHSGLGLHWLGDAADGDTAPLDEARYDRHFDRAIAVLAPFDAVERLSPALAVAQYQLLAGHPDAATLLDDWFLDWTDLDPGAIDPYLLHGRQLLPHRFGVDSMSLDRTARQATAASLDHLGRAAYPLLYLGALEEAPPEVLSHCDVSLFLDGLDDLFDCTPSQHLANRLARHLWQAATRPAPRSTDPHTIATAAQLQTALRSGFENIVHRHLRYGLPDVWGGSAQTLWHIAQAFETPLTAGATVVFGDNGAEIAEPASIGQAG